MRGLIADTFAEMLDRKLLWVFAIVTGFALLIVFGLRALENLEIQGQEIDLTGVNGLLAQEMIRGYDMFMYFLVFLGVLATAGLIPNMLIRGRSDYYLSKPISRTQLLVGKTLSIWIVYGGTIVAAVAVMYLAGGLSVGVFPSEILTVIGINLLILVVWLSVTVFAGVAFGSNAMAVMTAFAIWLAQYLLSFHEWVSEVTSNGAVIAIIDTLYYIMPKTSQMSNLALEIASGRVTTWLPLWSSLLFAAVLFGVTLALFRRKDY
jgi:ABC-type transport system involved in multi-copper enzyme maturation permease subunit